MAKGCPWVGCLGRPTRPAEGVLGEAQRLGNDPLQVAEAQAGVCGEKEAA